MPGGANSDTLPTVNTITKSAVIVGHLTSDIVHQQLEPCERVSISVAALFPTSEVLHGCHLSHRCRCDHREDPGRDVNVRKTLTIDQRQVSRDRRRAAYSSAAVELANACRAGGSSVSVRYLAGCVALT